MIISFKKILVFKCAKNYIFSSWQQLIICLSTTLQLFWRQFSANYAKYANLLATSSLFLCTGPQYINKSLPDGVTDISAAIHFLKITVVKNYLEQKLWSIVYTWD